MSEMMWDFSCVWGCAQGSGCVVFWLSARNTADKEAEMNIVYKNKVDHASTEWVAYDVDDFHMDGTVISDASAQAIAAWWHSPGSPLSTVLSTMGAVTEDMHIHDFASPREYADSDFNDKLVLNALEAYIETKQGK